MIELKGRGEGGRKEKEKEKSRELFIKRKNVFENCSLSRERENIFFLSGYFF